MKISHIWFDIGYTLLYMKRETTYQQALQTYGVDIPLETLEKEFHLVDKLFMREYPGVFLKERGVYMPWYLGILNYRLRIALDVSDVDRRWKKIQDRTENYWMPYQDAQVVLTELQQDSFRIGIISNWDHTARDVLKNADLFEYFEFCIISSEIGINKPDPKIFKLAMQQADAEPQHSLYIGDNYYDDAVGGRQAGMDVLIINRFDHLGVEEISDTPIIHDLGQIKKFLA